jgi:chemosensory pili system protein ChpA (sensor histidine kinase/response regulator)
MGAHVATGLKDLSMVCHLYRLISNLNFWKIAAAYFEAVAHSLDCQRHIRSRQVASRMLFSIRPLNRGNHGISERLPQDLLFLLADVSVKAARTLPMLSAVRAAYRSQAETSGLQAAWFGRLEPGL